MKSSSVSKTSMPGFAGERQIVQDIAFCHDCGIDFIPGVPSRPERGKRVRERKFPPLALDPDGNGNPCYFEYEGGITVFDRSDGLPPVRAKPRVR